MGSKDSKRDQNSQRRQEDESIKFCMKKTGSYLNVAGNSNFGAERFASFKRKFLPSIGSKVIPLSTEEAIKLISYQNIKRGHSDSSQGKFLHKDKHTKLSEKLSNAVTLKAMTHKSTQPRDARWTNQHGVIQEMKENQIPDVLTPREKVLKALRLFRIIFKDKAEHHAISKAIHDTRAIIIRDGKQVNGKKKVGVVPGVEVGDKFEYKAQLNIIGLHFNMSGGIDYLNIEGLDVATSIVISDGAAYNDIFDYDVVIYCGEGDYLKSRNKQAIEDQKMTRGNLSLVNNMKKKYPVRVIIGKKDQRGKQYIYVGLYLVEHYWKEQGPLGNDVFKFKLQRHH